MSAPHLLTCLRVSMNFGKKLILGTPYIPLGIDVAEALEVLSSLGSNVSDEEGAGERCISVETSGFRMAVYPEDDVVRSVWYDDPLGRPSARHVAKKVELYLARYGSLSGREMRMDNGWMHYWFHVEAGAAMVYGTHEDVLRFNRYTDQRAPNEP